MGLHLSLAAESAEQEPLVAEIDLIDQIAG